MKCINDKCENGLWSEDGCLFPEGTICSDFIPESEKSGVVPVESQSTGSLDSHRDAIIVAHGMASGNYVQTDTEMRRRIAKHLENVIRADKTMRDFLGWQENVKNETRGE